MSWRRGGISCPGGGGGGGGGRVNGIHCCPRGVNYTHPVLSHTVVPRRMRTHAHNTHAHTCT